MFPPAVKGVGIYASFMGRRVVLAMALGLLTGACTADSTPASSSEATTTPSTTTTSPVPDDPGHLAVLDDTGSVVVMRPDGTGRQPIAEASSANPAIYMQPVWSPDGSALAWGQQTGSGFGVGIGRPGSDAILTLTTSNMPFYTYWSPNGRHLGVLHNGSSGVQFQIADLEEETTAILDEDTPLYFSWNPSGDTVVTHAGAERVETFGVDGARMTLEPTSSSYLAPQWTDRGVFHVVDERLVVEDTDGRREVIAEVSGFTVFVANHDGTKVAVQPIAGAGPITASTEEMPVPQANTVVVIDTATAAMDTVTEGPALGFFWSPNGDRLLVFDVENSQITPNVWEADNTRALNPFIPHPTLLETFFPFFPQYAQSVSFWSPGSSAFAFAGVVGDQAGIWVQDLGAEMPTRVSDGSWVAWSSSGP